MGVGVGTGEGTGVCGRVDRKICGHGYTRGHVVVGGWYEYVRRWV